MLKLFNHLSTILFLQEPSLAQKKPELIGEKLLLLKVLKRKCQEPQWIGPFRVVICTHTAVQLQGKGRAWYHLSQCAKVPKGAPDQEEEKGSALLDTTTQNKVKCA